MIEVIRTLIKEEGALDKTFPVALDGRMYLIKVGDLIENAADLAEDRIELHAKHLIEAYSENNGILKFIYLWLLGREVLEEKPELAESLESMSADEWEARKKPHLLKEVVWGN